MSRYTLIDNYTGNRMNFQHFHFMPTDILKLYFDEWDMDKIISVVLTAKSAFPHSRIIVDINDDMKFTIYNEGYQN